VQHTTRKDPPAQSKSPYDFKPPCISEKKRYRQYQYLCSSTRQIICRSAEGYGRMFLLFFLTSLPPTPNGLPSAGPRLVSRLLFASAGLDTVPTSQSTLPLTSSPQSPPMSPPREHPPLVVVQQATSRRNGSGWS
jgi:hypothetical protein